VIGRSVAVIVAWAIGKGNYFASTSADCQVTISSTRLPISSCGCYDLLKPSCTGLCPIDWIWLTMLPSSCQSLSIGSGWRRCPPSLNFPSRALSKIIILNFYFNSGPVK
jgi:hypothetical protein